MNRVGVFNSPSARSYVKGQEKGGRADLRQGGRVWRADEGVVERALRAVVGRRRHSRQVAHEVVELDVLEGFNLHALLEGGAVADEESLREKNVEAHFRLLPFLPSLSFPHFPPSPRPPSLYRPKRLHSSSVRSCRIHADP